MWQSSVLLREQPEWGRVCANDWPWGCTGHRVDAKVPPSWEMTSQPDLMGTGWCATTQKESGHRACDRTVWGPCDRPEPPSRMAAEITRPDPTRLFLLGISQVEGLRHPTRESARASAENRDRGGHPEAGKGSQQHEEESDIECETTRRSHGGLSMDLWAERLSQYRTNFGHFIFRWIYFYTLFNVPFIYVESFIYLKLPKHYAAWKNHEKGEINTFYDRIIKVSCWFLTHRVRQHSARKSIFTGYTKWGVTWSHWCALNNSLAARFYNPWRLWVRMH